MCWRVMGGNGVMTVLGHGGITCVLQSQFSSFFLRGKGVGAGEHGHLL